jgi:hypothetical protein
MLPSRFSALSCCLTHHDGVLFLTEPLNFLLDEDINTSATIIPSVEILGPTTRSRAQQVNHQVNSFLCSSVYNIENQLLSNDLIVLRNEGEDHGGQAEHQEGAGELRRRAREGGEPIQFGIRPGVQDHLIFKLHTTSVLDVLHMHEKLRR